MISANRAKISMKVIKECQNYQTQSFIIYFKLFVGMLERSFIYGNVRTFLKRTRKKVFGLAVVWVAGCLFR